MAVESLPGTSCTKTGLEQINCRRPTVVRSGGEPGEQITTFAFLRELSVSVSGIGCASNAGMKLMFVLLLVASSVVAQSQTNKAASDSALRSALRDPRPQPARTNQAAKADSIRVVNGQPYQVITASNWVTLPGPNERAKYSRSSNYGPVFKLEKRMEARYKQGSSEGTRVWYEPIHEIAIKNYPEQGLVIDAGLPSIRAMPIRTTSEGIAVYDYGTLPKPRRSASR